MSTSTRIAFLMVALMVLVPLTGCHISINDGYVFDYKGKTATKNMIGDIDSSVTSIEIKNRFGDVHVEKTATGGNWSWDGTCWASDGDDAEFFLSELDMVVEQDGSTQTWTVSLPERDRLLRGVKSSLTIQVPAQVAVTIVNEHGNVSSHALAGNVNIDNEHGKVDTTELAGKTKIKNRHGDISASDFAGETEIDMEHGDLLVDQSSGKLNVKAEHGNVTVKKSTSDISTRTEHGKVSIVTAGYLVKCVAEHGDVEIQLTSAEFDTITANAEHADVDIYLPSTASPNLNLSVEHGKKKSDFQNNPSKSASRIKVDTEHGDIRIHEVK